jgi:hypothetical protein
MSRRLLICGDVSPLFVADGAAREWQHAEWMWLNCVAHERDHVSPFQDRQLWSAVRPRQLAALSARRHVASFQSGRIGALQIAWPNELSNTRYSNFSTVSSSRCNKKAAKKSLIFF